MSEPNEAQSALWNKRGGEIWVEQQPMLDRLFQPFERILAEAVEAAGARSVLDIGCGAGATTLAAAQRLGALGRCVGLDISATMIEAARRRAEAAGLVNIRFRVADAQTCDLEPAHFDAIVSRFGVMFFADPRAAFANLRRAAAPGCRLPAAGCRLTLIAWRSPADNPFMLAGERAASAFLPELAAFDPTAPGRFAFADAERVRGILAAAGWAQIETTPLDVACALREQELDVYATRMGKLGQLPPHLDEATRAQIDEAARRAYDPYVEAGEARFSAACWRIEARAG
ncbi:MAG TPA: class I SAM-dependent methyltransferase [Methylosinus sp.]|uniref:class I SAM-dependent methyltransferase n=1 Tax=Methylosinus sp. TaxID=427 RepID=UPI002F943575